MLVSLALAVVVAGWSAPAWAATQAGSPARPGNVTIYLAPLNKGGKDSNTGLTSSSPLLTLAHAQTVLQRLNPTGNVTIRIKQGTYLANAITWWFYVPGKTISFMPINYTGGGRPPGGDPAFVDPTSGGTHIGQTWFTAVLPAAPSPLHDGGTTGLHFYYLAVEDYTQGISFNGLGGHPGHNSTFYIQETSGLNGNEVSGMTFYDIGDLYAPVAPTSAGYGVILTTNSSDNNIYNDTFDNFNNSGDHDELHALYMTHFSSYNNVYSNLFEFSDGEAVKVRDRSNYNDVYDNTFNGTGGVSAYLDDFCDQGCVQENAGKYRECASYGNRFAYNTIETNAFWDLIPPGNDYAGGPPCTIPKGQVRLHTAGNKR
jgi:hypothetical protein